MSVCNDAAVQRIIPQVLLVNEKLVPIETYNEILSSLPPTFLCIRQAKAWMNTATMLRYIALLKRALAEEMQRRKVILYMDMCKAHYNPKVLAAITACGMNIVRG